MGVVGIEAGGTMLLRREGCAEVDDIVSLQVLRGVAAWLVVFHHYMQGFHHSNYDSSVGHFFAVGGKYGVDVFFVISGFIMVWTLWERGCSAMEFVKRRVLRIVPAYWVMTCVFASALVVLPSPFQMNMDWTLESFLQSIFFIPHLSPSGVGVFPLLSVGWTLNFEMFFYLFLGLMIFIFGGRWFSASVLFLGLMPLLVPKGHAISSVISSPLLHEFLMGMVVGRLFLFGRQYGWWLGVVPGALLVGAGLVLFGLAFWRSPLFDLGDVAFFWRFGDVRVHLGATLVVFGVIAMEHEFKQLPGGRVLRYLGNISYSTYLVHVLAILLVFGVMGRPVSRSDEVIALSLYTALTLGLSVLLYRWVEVGPVSRVLKARLAVAGGLRRTS